MEQGHLFDVIPVSKLDLLSRDQLVDFLTLEQTLRIQLQKEVERLSSLYDQGQQKSFFIAEQLVIMKDSFFGKSSEKSPKEDQEEKSKKPKVRKKKVQLPSERYPNVDIIEKDIELAEQPSCNCCGSLMVDSGMVEESEYLNVIPKKYQIIRQKRHKYRCCTCHGDLKTAPSLPRIIPGSSYSDDMIVDVGMSKYCDLIPIERYVAMAARNGFKGLPPHSLIETTHHLALFVEEAYNRIKNEILFAKILHADETTHRMLEGDARSNWYFWGFSTNKSCYFEIHNTRSGDVSSALLKDSQCEFLVTDVYSGYIKSVRVTNEFRKFKNLKLIQSIYCNSHSRRRFKAAQKVRCPDAIFFVEKYKKIYELEALMNESSQEERQKIRESMRPFFNEMKDRAIILSSVYSSKSVMNKALGYFLNNFDELTLFLKNTDLPIDNNCQERLLRSPVIGRKTWYGTHSVKGAKTAAILFSLVESCKLNKINPRKYFEDLVFELHQGKTAFTPKEYLERSL